MTELTVDQALQQGVEAHKAGQVQEADRLYTAILKAQPKHPDANHNMGVLAVGVGKVQEALPFFKTALEANPATAQFWLSYIDALIKLDQLADAKAVFDQAKSKGAKGDGFDKLAQRLNEAQSEQVESTSTTSGAQPKQPNILDQLKLDQAISLAKKETKEGSPDEAKRIYQDILNKFPKNKRASDGLKVLADGPVGKASKVQDPPKPQIKHLIDLYTQGHLRQSLAQAKLLLTKFPNSAVLATICGVSYAALNKLDAAIDNFNHAISVNPNYLDAYINLGHAFKKKGDLNSAINIYKAAQNIQPSNPDAYFNLGKVYAVKRDFEVAIKYYEEAIKLKPDYAKAYFNKGNALKEANVIEAAIKAYKHAINIKPNYADAYNNLGIAWLDQGNSQDALKNFKKAIKLQPNHAVFYNNLGIALRQNGELDASIQSFKHSLEINPDYAEAYNNMGVTLQKLGYSEAAAENYHLAILLNPNYSEAFNNLGIALKGARFTEFNSSIAKTIVNLLDKKRFVRPIQIAQNVINFVKLDPNFAVILELSKQNKTNKILDQILSQLSKMPLLLKMLKLCPIPDLEIETLLIELRSNILKFLPKLSGSMESLAIQSALALQCYTNEYIYIQTNYEMKAVKELESDVSAGLLLQGQPTPSALACLASYKAIHDYPWCHLLQFPDNLLELKKRQFSEYKHEMTMRNSIPFLGDITDAVSVKVREQYEEHPYPKWVDLKLSINPKSIFEMTKQIGLQIIDKKIFDCDAPQILIAGCGTGQQSIETSSHFKNANVLAIDLSLSSLCYAKRKTGEMGIDCIDYLQADILDLWKLDKKFNIIECAGVLHHMGDPLKGWTVLTDRLNSGGLMRISLYSELARQDIVKLRNEIVTGKVGSDCSAIRAFRSKLLKSDKPHHKRVFSSPDSFSVSELRDLIFHVQEHRFNMLKIKECLEKLGLGFCGFETDHIVKKFRASNYGFNDPYNLDKWHSFEKENPYTFSNTNAFWCQKLK